MKKINLIIFSKNRASQLHLLLESLNLNSNDFFDKINILYTYNAEEYRQGYNKLIEQFPNVNFVKEVNFKIDLLSLFDDCDYTSFMVDDNVLYSKIDKENMFNLFSNKVLCFSLRLGLNCVYSHPADKYFKIKNQAEDDGILIWNWRDQEVDFSYPLSTDGHLFKTSLLKDLIGGLDFINPNTLETSMQCYLPHLSHSYMMSFKESKLVGIPNNLVNTSHNNRHGLKYYKSEKELNDLYLNNVKISLNLLDISNITGAHQEIEYKYETKG